ncbi:hypothetical protein ACFQ9Q_05740 [Streptomyces virginiae]|uniref:hypothetical protein n=1 Tax=Streptomyces virginiae TaxID=1961 RepID=UPI0036930CE3
MNNALLALAGAIVAVTGTLLAPILSQRVLARVHAMTVTPAGAYGRTLLPADGNPQPGWSFEEIQIELLRLGDRWKDMRGIMRADLGVDPGQAGPADS